MCKTARETIGGHGVGKVWGETKKKIEPERENKPMNGGWGRSEGTVYQSGEGEKLGGREKLLAGGLGRVVRARPSRGGT